MFYLPFTRLVATLMSRIIPDRSRTPDNLASPAISIETGAGDAGVALSNATLETVRMSELLDRMFDIAPRDAAQWQS